MRKGLFSKHVVLLLSFGWVLVFGAGETLCQNAPPIFDYYVDCYVSRPDSEDVQLCGGGLEESTFVTCNVRERERLEVSIYANDPDGDSLFISVLNPPPSAFFEDVGNGEARLVWMPEFTGPWSSSQSPFEIFFEASDGSLSSKSRVIITVINVNRIPELILPESSTVAVGNELVFQVRAEDADSEEVTIQALNPPPEASFDEGTGIFRWMPQLADAGWWSVTFQVTDLSGGDCFRKAHIRVVPPSVFNLSLGVEETLLGGVVELPINMVNSDQVAGMELLVQFDPTMFTLLDVFTTSTRTEDWEYFSYKEKPWGLYQQIKIVGIADYPNQFDVDPLLPDSGVIAYLKFKVTTDPYLNGFLIPLEFYSFDFTDNTLSTSHGEFITQEMINLNQGGVLLNSENTLIGDINENGLPFEVGDAVKMAAYLSGTISLTPQQMINSDVNQDGHMATISDLVFLIKNIVEAETVPQVDGVTTGKLATVKITDDLSRTLISIDADLPISGAMLIFKGKDLDIQNVELSPEAGDLDLYTYEYEDEFRLLIVDQQAKPLPAGDGYLFSFQGENFDTIEIALSDPEGELMKVEQEYQQDSRPSRFALFQNYPNPFNPSTRIRYLVGGDGSAEVSLKVYNVAGQLVKTLVNEENLPGEYVITWNGKNENYQDVASGVYFYKLEVSDYVETKRMLLLK